MSMRINRLIVLAVLMITATPFAFRAFALSPMYLDISLAHMVERRLAEIVDREGWILSDIEVRAVTADSVTLIHRQHIRGVDPTACFVLSLSDALLRPCANI